MSELKEVKDLLTDLRVSSGRIEEKVAGLSEKVELAMKLAKEDNARTNKRIDGLETKHDVLEKRVRSNENRNAVIGAVGGGAAGLGISLLVAFLKSKI